MFERLSITNARLMRSRSTTIGRPGLTRCASGDAQRQTTNCMISNMNNHLRLRFRNSFIRYTQICRQTICCNAVWADMRKIITKVSTLTSGAWLQNTFFAGKNYRTGSFYCRMYFQRRYRPLLRMMEVMGITIGPQAKIMANKSHRHTWLLPLPLPCFVKLKKYYYVQ